MKQAGNLHDGCHFADEIVCGIAEGEATKVAVGSELWAASIHMYFQCNFPSLFASIHISVTSVSCSHGSPFLRWSRALSGRLAHASYT